MSIGTAIIQEALSEIKAHSVVSPANPESLETGMNVLNGMIATWQDKGIETGAVPLKEVGSELSEPLGARNGIVQNLAILLQPKFPSSQLNPLLVKNAALAYQDIENAWRIPVIPRKILNSSFPTGQGNKNYDIWDNQFFGEDQEIG